MKKLMIIAAMLLVTVSVNSANSFNIGKDSLRIHPSRLDGYVHETMTMTIDGMTDNWHCYLSYPDGFMPRPVGGIIPREGLTVDYLNEKGYETTYTATLNVGIGYTTISSYIDIPGYWDYNMDDEWETYGTVKWMPGTYQVYDMNFYVCPSFRRGYMTINGVLDCSPDRRGAILANVITYSRVWVWVGYQPGDMNGDETYSIADVTILISYVLKHGEGEYNEWQHAAADMNGDGQATIADVTMLTSKVLKQ